MENLEVILSIAGAALGLLITAITFVIKFINAIKAKNKEEAIKLMAEFAQQVVQEVEVIKSKSNSELNGETKKEMALTKLNQLCINNNIKFDSNIASELIEKVVALTKTVNARQKDIINNKESSSL